MDRIQQFFDVVGAFRRWIPVETQAREGTQFDMRGQGMPQEGLFRSIVDYIF